MGDDQPYDEDFWGKDGLEPYKYTPISPGEIRCLVLQPGRGDKSLSCTLEVRRLADQPPYEAISYVWGKLSRCHKIKCDGRRLFITPNLRDALRQCRLSDSKRILWADSICINQDDDEEKSQQVSVMSEIYSQAERVLICFGPDRTGGCAQDAQSFLHDFNEMFEKSLENISGDWGSFPYTEAGNPLLGDSRWSSWTSFVRQPWFYRGWVVQEAGLAKFALVLWGRARIHWLWVQRMMAWGARRMNVRREMGQSESLHVGLYKIRYKAEANTLWEEGTADYFAGGVLDILDSARSLDINDNRDRIYAFLGLPGAKFLRDRLGINYGKTWKTVFQDFACCYLDCTHDLSILDFIESTEATISPHIDYPSWIPQWQHSVYQTRLSGGKGKWDHKKFLRNQSTSPRYIRLENGVLQVRGLIMDFIAFVSPCLSDSMTASGMAAIWRAIICHRSNPIYEKIPPLYAFLSVMAAGMRPATLTDGQWKAQHKECMRRLGHGGQVRGGKDSEATSDSTSDDPNDPGVLWQHIQWIIHNRRVAVTRRGYYCLVPYLAREGDICAVIFGTTLPFILRGAGRPRFYKVIGETFVTSRREVDWEAAEEPYELGCGYYANEDWLDWGLEEEDIWLC